MIRRASGKVKQFLFYNGNRACRCRRHGLKLNGKYFFDNEAPLPVGSGLPAPSNDWGPVQVSEPAFMTVGSGHCPVHPEPDSVIVGSGHARSVFIVCLIKIEN